MLACMITAGMLEGIGIAALLPLLDLIVGGDGDSSLIAGAINDNLRRLGLEPTIGLLLALLVILITAKSFVLVIAAKQIGYTAAVTTMRLRLQLLKTLMRARWQFFIRQRMGSISASIISEPSRAAATYVLISRVLTGVPQIIIYLGLSFAISLEVSLAAVVVGILSAVLLHRFVVIAGKMGQRQTTLTKFLLSGLSDGLLSMKSTKAMARENQLSELLSEDIQAMNKVQQTQILARESLLHYREPITTAALALGLYIILTQWTLELESLLVMAFLFLRTVNRVANVQNNVQRIADSLPAFWFVRSVMSTAANAAEEEGQRIPPRFQSGIHLREVSFGYQRNKTILDRVSLDFPKGSFVAIAGASGGGKTTLADLVTGLLRPTAGELLIDDTPLSAINQRQWRSMIGYVPQDATLLHDSILNNITLRDPKITESMARQALEDAGAWSFVSELPEGIDAVVGARGIRMSGGQRQRIAIARALAHQPEILILDEATAALDPQTEAEICRTLKKLAGKLTIIAISHQDAMQEAADVVYRVENGKASCVRGPKQSVLQFGTGPQS